MRVINELLGIRGETRATLLSLRRKQRRQQSIRARAQLPSVSQHEPQPGVPCAPPDQLGHLRGLPGSINLSWALSDVLPGSLGDSIAEFHCSVLRHKKTALFSLTISKTVT